jgi:hypothetical protein
MDAKKSQPISIFFTAEIAEAGNEDWAFSAFSATSAVKNLEISVVNGH